ncbi:MAG: hypothetical protein KGY99_07585 [Phycisphaerae bacterium]|nr:hypothetical protein [Phycisphaerae bacterium]
MRTDRTKPRALRQLRSRRTGPAVLLAVALATSALNAPPAAAAAPAELAYMTLSRLVTDAQRGDQAIGVLAGTEDIDLVRLFVSLRHSDNAARRQLAVDFLHTVSGEKAADVLRQRLRVEPAPHVRRVILTHLLDGDAATREDLDRAAGDDDPRVRLLAARGLQQAGATDRAAAVLADLVDAETRGVGPMARLGLVKVGEASQLGPLRDLVASDTTRADLLAAMMGQIRADKIVAAAPLARAVIDSDRDPLLRMMGWDALAAVTDAREALRDAIRGADSARVTLSLIRILADGDDPGGALRSLTDGKPLASRAARLAVARHTGDAAAVSEAALAAVRLEHAMLSEYVLIRATDDADKPYAGAYTDALLHLVRTAPRDTRSVGRAHRLAARATALLADAGGPKALRALGAILDGRYSARQRAVAAGLLRCDTEAACALARRIADSAYRELASDAALVLGRNGRREALDGLTKILAHPDRHPPGIRLLASWYVLKLTGQGEAAARRLAAELD